MKVKMSAQGGSASGGKKYFKQTIFCVVFLSGFLACKNVEAACTGSSPTWTAADNTVAEIQACINGATAGDTINVPEGAGSVEWTSYININKSVKIIGPGQNIDDTFKLKITWTGDYAFGNASGVNDWRVSGFEFNTASGNLGFDINNSTGWRIDHNKYHNTHATATGSFVVTGVTTQDALMAGVIDNNNVISGRAVLNNGNVGSLLGGYIWHKALTLGANNTNTVYIEDNTFTAPDGKSENCVDASRGGDYVFRYNLVTSTEIMAHSIQGSAVRGTRKWEAYGNRFRSTNSTPYAAVWMRGGTGVIFINDFTSDVPYNANIVFDNVRDSTPTYSADNTTTQYGLCDGDHTWDGNEDATGWPCRDQIGTSSDATLWTSGTTPVPIQAKAPTYLWANYDTGSLTYAFVKEISINHIKTNRDYYEQPASFNGTSGTGCGTLANRPATCTAGVGYWATTQSCSDLTDYIGASPTTPISGTLYKCTATDTWTEYYTPYTYPHPLRTEMNDIVAPASPTGLSVS